MKTVQEFLIEEQLNEKLLLINNGKRYGQIVILAGGAGSGKGFATSKFLNSQDYKIRDVDEMKKSFIKLDKLTNKYPEVRGLNLRNPSDVAKLHMFVDKMGTKDKTLSNMLKATSNPKTLPNILFDVTFKNTRSIDKFMPDILAQGYKEENIHLVWVLTDYKVAVSANRSRERVVPDDILLQTHEGAANTMWGIVNGGKIPKYIDGGVYVVLNNRENTINFKKADGKDIKTTGKGFKSSVGGKSETEASSIIKDFKYLTFKKPKKSPMSNAKIKLQLWSWITNNIPVTKLTSHIWDAK